MATTDFLELELPPGADSILERCRSLPRKGTSLLIYGLAGVVQDEDIECLCREATAVYEANDALEEYQDYTFFTPAPKDLRLPGETVQGILNSHVELLANVTSETNEHQHYSSIFPFAFIVIEDQNWRKHGVTIVAYHDRDIYGDDEDLGWRVDECETSVLSLGGFCQDLVMEEEEWHPLTVDLGRPTARTGSVEYSRTRSRTWSAPSISSLVAAFG